LRFVTDRGPGISRKRSGRGFSYRTPDGATVRDRAVLARIHAYRHLRDGRSDGPVSKRVILQAIRETADRLGNTAAVTRTSYVHPGVIEAFSNGAVPTARRSSVADADEREVIALLRRPNGRSR
jgi:DNA topoisomerase IB